LYILRPWRDKTTFDEDIMKHLILVGSALAMVGASCVDLQSLGFGPFPSSSLGGSVAGVASFVPGAVPGEGQFALVVFNTDSANTFDVTVTSLNGAAVTKTAAPCGVANFAPSCTAASVLVSVAVTGSVTNPSLTVIPPANCGQQIVFIVPGTTSGTTTTPPTLTQSVPSSAATCGVGGTPTGGFGGA
jgi:hypothetical protein